MIVLRAVRVEDSGAETELGEVRLTEVGAVFAHTATADGSAVISDVVERMRVPTLDDATNRVFAAAAREGYNCTINLKRPRRGRAGRRA